MSAERVLSYFNDAFLFRRVCFFHTHLSQAVNNIYQVVMISISLATEQITYIKGVSQPTW